MAKSRTNARRYSIQALEHMVAALEEELTKVQLENAQLKEEKKKATTPAVSDATLVRTNQKLTSTIMKYRKNMMGLRGALERELILKESYITQHRDMKDLLKLIADQRMPAITAAYQARLVLKESNTDQTNMLGLMLPGIYNP